MVTAVMNVSPLARWPYTRITSLLDLERPIIQGPFGGGLSSVELVAAVSGAGGLGSFGMQHLEPEAIAETAAELHARVTGPFAVNLWVKTHDLAEAEMTRERFAAAVARLQPVYDELGVAAPAYPARFAPSFGEQAAAVLAARPRVFSFVAGVPDSGLLDEFRSAGIRLVGTATTPEEAVALDEAGVDAIVASGFEAGGHRLAFLAPAEDSLIGTLALVRTVVEEVRAPVIAAGGIADARGIVAALALGAEAVQIGSAFLATEESGATPEHRAALLSGAARHTTLTRVFTGRLSRGVENRLVRELRDPEPFPYQAYLMRPLMAAARAQGRTDLAAMWAGQSTAVLVHRHAVDLYAALVDGTQALLERA
jgi:nitronate monooxygenase